MSWQQSFQRIFDENSRQKEVDYKSDNLLLQLEEQQSDCTHIHTHGLFIWITVQEQRNLPDPSVRGMSKSGRMYPGVEIMGLRLACCCNMASLSAYALP